MSHYIPVFYFPIERKEIPENRNDWDSAMNILRERLEKRDKYTLWECTSRNWWVQHALLLICQGLGIEGFEFIDTEITYLGNKELETASNALQKVLCEIRNGIPRLGPETDEEGSIWYLRHYRDKGKDKEFSIETMKKAFSESEVIYKIDIFPDTGYKSVVGFYSFIKSLQAAVNEAICQDMSLMYFQIQP